MAPETRRREPLLTSTLLPQAANHARRFTPAEMAEVVYGRRPTGIVPGYTGMRRSDEWEQPDTYATEASR